LKESLIKVTLDSLGLSYNGKDCCVTRLGIKPGISCMLGKRLHVMCFSEDFLVVIIIIQHGFTVDHIRLLYLVTTVLK